MSSTLDKLIRMANQISTELENQQGANAATATWDHLWHFWDPRMRDAICDHVAAGGGGLTPTALAAVHKLAQPREPTPQTGATAFPVDADGVSAADAG